MFHGNGNVDVTMMLTVRAYPFFVVENRTDNVHRRRSEPLAVIALLQLHLVGFVLDYAA